MLDGRGARFALEAGFLLAVAVVAAFADLRPLWVVLVMLVAWIVVALLEWAAWRDRPHWASGLPPRYYVPQAPLPPRPPSVELPSFTSYPRPAPREAEAPTWIATPAMRAEVLGWPAPALDGGESIGEASAGEPQTTVEELPEELLAEAAGAAVAAASSGEAWPVDDPWIVQELPAEPVVEVAPEPPPLTDVGADVAASLRSTRPARHRLDPFAEPARRRWPWRRGIADESAVAELPPLPRHVRVLPRRGPEGEG